jgi:hypothetical protein
MRDRNINIEVVAERGTFRCISAEPPTDGSAGGGFMGGGVVSYGLVGSGAIGY